MGNLHDSRFKEIANKLISYFKNSAGLMFFIEIMKLQKNLEPANKKFNLYGVMTFVEDLNKNTL
jgi:hypothetical protein